MKSFIVKAGDDLRKEVLAMQLIEYCQHVFSREGLGIALRPYQIVSTGQQTGTFVVILYILLFILVILHFILVILFIILFILFIILFVILVILLFILFLSLFSFSKASWSL